ncbi:hypothetical protein PYCC9005_001366 [Savitreella phatthalungensis]
MLLVVLGLAGSAFMLLGYDNGVMGGVVNNTPFLKSFHLSKQADVDLIGTVVALYEIGCCAGALCVAGAGDLFGRRVWVYGGAVLMVVGACVQAGAGDGRLWEIGFGRVVSGIGMGCISSTVPVLQAELVVAGDRGKQFCRQLSCLNAGIMLAYWADYGFNRAYPRDPVAWRVPVALQLIAIVAVVALTLPTPESPRWLMTKGRKEEARAVVARMVHNDQHQVQRILRDISDTVESERAAKPWQILREGGETRPRARFAMACFVQAAQQAGLINGLIFYGGPILAKTGLNDSDASLVSGFLFTWFFLASFIPHLLIDRAGRRKLLLYGCSAMAAVFAIEAVLIRRIEQGDSPKYVGALAATFLFFYLGLFTTTFQAVVWAIPSEILPLNLRSFGSGVSTASNWLINFAVVQMTPHAIAHIGWKYFLMAAFINASFVPVFFAFMPETARMPLEAVDAMYAIPHKLLETGRLRARYEGAQATNAALSRDDSPKSGEALVEQIR